MAQEEISQVDRITKLLNENRGLKIVGGEFGEVTITQRDPQKLDDILQVVHVALKREPTTEKIGMGVRVSKPSNLKTLTTIDIFPKNDKEGYFVIKGFERDPESVFKIIRSGLELFNAYRDCPPEEKICF
jgi:hypothetical protein